MKKPTILSNGGHKYRAVVSMLAHPERGGLFSCILFCDYFHNTDFIGVKLDFAG